MKTKKDRNSYAEYLAENELAENTIEIYMREADRLECYLAGEGITKKKMLAYKRLMEAFGYAPTTLNLHIVAVNRYLRYLDYSDCTLKANRIQARQSLLNTLSVEEYQKLLNYARESGREKYYAIMRTLAMTGIRIGELKYFTVEILDKQAIQVTGKKKTREIYLPDNLVSELEKYCKNAGIEKGAIFVGRTDKPINRTTVYKMLIRMADMIGIEKEKVHPHNFRHLFALTYMKKYANLFELADLLGHSSLETTRIYARSTMTEKRKRINEMGL